MHNTTCAQQCSIYQNVDTLAASRDGVSSMHRKAGYVQREFIGAPLKDRCQNTAQLLVDIHLMMHADYFVGTHLSLKFPQSLSRSLRFASSSRRASPASCSQPCLKSEIPGIDAVLAALQRGVLQCADEQNPVES